MYSNLGSHPPRIAYKEPRCSKKAPIPAWWYRARKRNRKKKKALRRLVCEARGNRGVDKGLLKRGLKADRLSCQRFFADHRIRLLLYAAAYSVYWAR